MATDIAFAVGALMLVGRRAPATIRVLLLAIAILDDIGGVIVIAVFYSEGLAPRGVAVAVIAVVVILALQGNKVRRPIAYLPAAIALWLGLAHSGVHPTMAGVALGLLTPPQRGFGEADADARSPSERLQTALHPWVAFGVMPIFAFANAGVALDWSSADPRIAGGIIAGLVVGKPLGVVLGAWLAVRARLARLPDGIGWREVAIVGLVAGVGFTVALFIATLALADPVQLASAKLGILIGSCGAIGLAIAAGRIGRARGSRPAAGPAPDPTS
jgi:NhaA family Na+:H+ antiporter